MSSLFFGILFIIFCMITDEELKEFNRKGLIPGPGETEDQFLRRVKYCLNLKEELDVSISAFLDAPASKELSDSVLKEAFKMSSQLYDCTPEWIPLMFSNYKLAPWHGGSAWIFQKDETTPVSALLQLRQAYRENKVLYGIYPRHELLAHEIAHVGRMMYEEPQFEEMLAYQSSSGWISKMIGPILESSKESLFFVLITLLVFCMSLFLFFHEMMSLTLLLLPLFLAGYGLLRLIRKRNTFNACLAVLSRYLNDENKAQWVIYRLTDREICLFAKSSSREIEDYMAKENSLRWRLLKIAYLQPQIFSNHR